MSQSNSLAEDQQESNHVHHPATAAVDDHGHHCNETQNVQHQGVEEVSCQISDVLLSGSSNSKRSKDDSENHEPYSCDEHRTQCHHQLDEAQEDNPSGRTCHHSCFYFSRSADGLSIHRHCWKRRIRSVHVVPHKS